MSFPNDIKGTTLYYYHNGLDNDGKLDIHVTMKKSLGDPEEFILQVDFSGIADSDIRRVKDKIKKLRTSINIDEESFHAVPSEISFTAKVPKSLGGSYPIFQLIY